MYYCFLKEDIEQLTYDPLIIQKEYAMRLGSLYVGSLEQQTIYDASGTKVSIADKRVLLRCTYDNMIAGIRLLSKQGANLVETEHDVERIESWYRLGLTRRSIGTLETEQRERATRKARKNRLCPACGKPLAVMSITDNQHSPGGFDVIAHCQNCHSDYEWFCDKDGGVSDIKQYFFG